MIDVAATVEFAPSYHPDAARAEVQALFFLAGWREHAAPGFAPWLVCIDAPPPSVCWLAEQTGARLIHAPPDEADLRRARAWDPFPGEHARRLVLDPEVLVIKNPASALSSLPAGTILAAAPASRSPLPEACWRAIYRAVGVTMPTERLRTLRAELGLPAGKKGDTMPPFYHPAALLAPSRVSLGALWTRHAALLARAWPALEGLSDGQRTSVAVRERVALTTAVQAMRISQGGEEGLLPCHPLPRAWDGRQVGLEAGRPLREMAMLYIPGLFGELTDLAQIQMWLEAYAVRWREKLLDRAGSRGAVATKTRWWVSWQTRRMEASLRRLYQHHVRPALWMGGELG